MSRSAFDPTPEQTAVIQHNDSAFVAACPGAGKTRVIVERARLLLGGDCAGKGIAFLSFTNAAVSQLVQRLRDGALLPSPVFPHFVGTFDSFVWQFVVSPFGVPGCDRPPRLIPDIGDFHVRPSDRLQGLPFDCFELDGAMIAEEAKYNGYDASANPGLTKAYESTARALRVRLSERGELDFAAARSLAIKRLSTGGLADRLRAAIAARFCEVIVDEAQDCNPADLTIIDWLRSAGIVTKVICDPHQAIYGFRGGVTEHLLEFGSTYDAGNRLPLSGNFRSSKPICQAIVALRPSTARTPVDQAVGCWAEVMTPVHLLSYTGNGAPAAVGEAFRALLAAEAIDVAQAPVVASAWNSAKRAVGQPGDDARQTLTIQLASAVTAFHFNFEAGNRSEALRSVHEVLLKVEARLGDSTYHQYLAEDADEAESWRPRVITLVRQLRYGPEALADPQAWLDRARELLGPSIPKDGPTIKQLLRWTDDLPEALAVAPTSCPPASSIHAVKGREFPAVCVVMVTKTAKSIVDYLTTGLPDTATEDARKVYVGASRAQRLLAIAVPRSQVDRLRAHLEKWGAPVQVTGL